jgi:hypothetical protein
LAHTQLEEGEEAMEPNIHHRLSSWRQVVHEGEYSAQHWDEPAITDELLETHLRLLHHQNLLVVQARDRYYASVKAYIEQESRPADQQVFVENAGAASLKVFSQASTHYLELAILRSVQAQREEARRRPVSIHPPLEHQSFMKRLLGG